MEKVKIVISSQLAGAPHKILLVLDATTGIVLTKLDGTAKGGVMMRIAHEFTLPVRYIGMGEGLDNLHIFENNDFVAVLLD
ncbi:MAG: hypothetical protein A2031_07770 [Deltaproteobacteria bacterium RBG_19FT_COMBO_43_11]|nr:MAG: hypothetical protein A2031_07770 [Deltaproteobacteria bacterium RBG_19FT_COMBO_43_11]